MPWEQIGIKKHTQVQAGVQPVISKPGKPPLMAKFLNTLSYPVLIVAALLLGLSPLGAEPHLIGKLRMLAAGQLSRPLDIFDLLLHAAPLVLLALKLLYTPRQGA